MNDNPLVSVALCTYNGESFLKEQLDSIVNQTYPNLEIVIVDDGSTDGTIDILNEFAQVYCNIRVFKNEVNLGYIKNFEKAVGLCTGEFIALSDQDDIWSLNKIDYLVQNFQLKDTLIYHDSQYIDENNGSLGRLLSQTSGYIDGRNKLYVAYNNCVAGHAMFFRQDLVQKIFPFPDKIPHDHWIAYIALAEGGIRFIKKPLVNYRQHASSVTDILGGKIDSNSKRLKEQRRYEHNEKRIETIECLKQALQNTKDDVAFLAKLAMLLKDRQKKRRSRTLFLFLLANWRVLFHFYHKSFLSIFVKTVKESQY